MKLVLALLALGLASTVGCSEERPRPDANPTGRLHPSGILDENSDNFHGRLLAREGYDFAVCARCHGEDFRGGIAEASCFDCHADGPTTCATCHRTDNEQDAHQVHREGSVECAECHVVPAAWDAEGHVRRNGRLDPLPAEVTFGELAALPTPDRKGPPTFADGRCDNVYCHGDALPPAGGANLRPAWEAPPVRTCDRCHGAPPPDHAPFPVEQCRGCHPTGAAHIDGTIEVGRTDGCDGCHGRAGDPAPPVDLSGNEFTTALGVGAHQAHLEGPSRLRGPIPCITCHLVPTAISTPGHIDSVQPAEVHANVGWNRTTATCGVWCHGTVSPVWTSGGGAACGTCHGVPPATPVHAGATSLSSCATAGCHSSSIDSFGNFLFTTGPDGPVSEHIDGDVDVF